MTTLTVRHTVSDFDTWKDGFDGHEVARKEHGCTALRVLRDGNDVLVLMDFPARSNAQAFASDPSLKEAMKHAGVQGAPDITFRDEAESKSY